MSKIVINPAVDPNLVPKIHKRVAQILLQNILTGVLLFSAAGSLSWLWGWVYMALSLASTVVNAVVLLKYNPEVIAERSATKASQKAWDKVLVAIFGFFAVPGTMVVAGLDIRFGWAPFSIAQIHWIGILIFLLSGALFLWALAVNQYFATDVRIQVERDHKVISRGPYRFVRHPGYVGLMGGLLAQPLLLGALWALIPAGLAMMVLLVRTALEDNTLQSELGGYCEYARQTPYRLFPGIW